MHITRVIDGARRKRSLDTVGVIAATFVTQISEAFLIPELIETISSTGAVIAFLLERCVGLFDAISAKQFTSFALRNSTQQGFSSSRSAVDSVLGQMVRVTLT